MEAKGAPPVATTLVRSTVPSARLAQSTDLTRRIASRKLSVALWTTQSLLAVLFVMTGAMKLLMPADVLAAQTPLPIAMVRFIGSCELAGALGLLLPGLLRIRPGLTPLAAAGLVVLMICATILTPILISPDPVLMLLPVTVGALAAFVGYARLRLAPLRGRSS
jgi:uncharacterized membrane protein